mmetsp:Transcript_117526/g.279039  ORF Transcript_117526/g.279039 Transcript_117526/m.279039 type:complete len:224 (-) Transcript_117526:49-720(-)
MLAASQVVYHYVVHTFNQCGPIGSLLEVNDQQQACMLSVPLDKQLEKLRNYLKLLCRGHGSHEENWLRCGIDVVEATDAALVSLVHAGISRVIMPEGVVVAPVRCHADARHYLLGIEFEEAIPTSALVPAIPQEMHQTLMPCSHPVKGQCLSTSADVLEGELRATEATQRNQHYLLRLGIHPAFTVRQLVHHVRFLHTRLPLRPAYHLHCRRHEVMTEAAGIC